MHPAGQGSWRVGIESSSSLLDIALFTRDACGLDVPADAGVPPPVATTVPDLRDALAPALRSPAGAQWLSWWDALVAQVGAVQLGSLVLPASTAERLETLAALDQGLLDWPDLDALATRPALREAVRAVGAEARRWSGEQRRKVALDTRAGDPSPIAHTAVRDAAEATMTQYSVPPERVRAGIVCSTSKATGGIWPPRECSCARSPLRRTRPESGRCSTRRFAAGSKRSTRS